MVYSNTTPDQQNTSTDFPEIRFYCGKNYVMEESIGYMLKQIMISMQRSVDTKMEPLDLTAMQWTPLLLIAHGKSRTAADVARCSGIDTGAVTRMLDRLEAKGLISRARSVEDKRLVYLKLTAAGESVAAKIPVLICESLNQRLQGFSQQEFDTLKLLLQRLLSNDQQKAPE